MSNMIDLPDDILIVGLGRTGIATARFLAGMGKTITIADGKEAKDLAPSLEKLRGIDYIGRFGAHREEDFLSHPMIIVSPGVDSELPVLKAAKAKGVHVIGEMELACMFIKEPIIAITGTNGKTTVTTLVGEIFTKAFTHVFVGGNIGNPLINYVIEDREAAYVVVEVSSFQLETVETFRPQTAVLLNITEDHLDRYRSFDDYRRAKFKIFENQTMTDCAILNDNLPDVPALEAKKLYFSTERPLAEGAFLENGIMHIRLNGHEYLYPREISPLVGIHNTENLLVALLIAHIYGINQGLIENVVRQFKGLGHRVEFVREVEGVAYYNDSKATNVDAARRALESMGARVILIAGGKDKGGSYQSIRQVMDRIKALILFGEAKEKIKKELGRFTQTYVTEDLGTAVTQAVRISERGDVVLFSPMCSSFDMFRDYQDRGDSFKRIVESL
jgi:UDP-N-acetylmuramoylalanine--D-glutamate ligase